MSERNGNVEHNLEARKLIEKSIAAKEAQMHKVDKERRAAWRKHGRTQDQIKALDAELVGLRAALESLGGSTEIVEDDGSEAMSEVG
jgi:chromosome segregation ATPase